MKGSFGKVNIFNVDCVSFMKQKPDNYYDVAIVDPDYGLDAKLTSGGTWANKYTKEDGLLGGKPNEEYFKELFRVSKNQIIWGGNYFDLPPTRCFIVWDKIARMDTLADCEFAWTSFDRNAKIFKNIRNTGEKRIHITQKPIRLYKWILLNYASKGDKILDTHLGSGSSAIAADELGFEFDGCEISQARFALCEQRINRRLSQIKLF